MSFDILEIVINQISNTASQTIALAPHYWACVSEVSCAFPSQREINAETDSMSRCHHVEFELEKERASHGQYSYEVSALIIRPGNISPDRIPAAESFNPRQ